MQRVTIKDVANRTGFSVPTVSKALTNRNGTVNQETRQYIIDTANSMGYKVNHVAQSLSRKEVRVGVIKPNEWPQFYGEIYKGIVGTLEQLSNYNVSYYTKEYANDVSDKDLTKRIETFLEDNIDALIICTDVFHNYSKAAELLKENNVLVAEVGNSVISGADVVVRVDSKLAGRLAGEYMDSIIPADGETAVFIANKSMPDHMEKVEGFCSELNKNTKRTIGVYETNDIYEDAYAITKDLLENKSGLTGIYVATVNSEAVCRCLSDMNRRDIKLLVTDVQTELIPFVETGIISATIFQNTILQGRISTNLVYDELISSKRRQKSELVTPEIVLRSNYKNYIEDYSLAKKANQNI